MTVRLMKGDENTKTYLVELHMHAHIHPYNAGFSELVLIIVHSQQQSMSEVVRWRARLWIEVDTELSGPVDKLAMTTNTG